MCNLVAKYLKKCLKVLVEAFRIIDNDCTIAILLAETSHCFSPLIRLSCLTMGNSTHDLSLRQIPSLKCDCGLSQYRQ